MVKYIGPKLKIQRRLGKIFSLAKQKSRSKILSPGEHGKKLDVLYNNSFLETSYQERFIQKQKLKFFYGITEKKLFSYYNYSKRKGILREEAFIEVLELRLDNIVFQLGFAPTIAAARQYISHGHIFVNNFKVDIPSFSCSKGDEISVGNNTQIRLLVQNNLNFLKFKTNNILEKFKDYNFFKKLPLTIIPKYLALNETLLIGTIVAKPLEKDLKLGVNFLKIIEYYSK